MFICVYNIVLYFILMIRTIPNQMERKTHSVEWNSEEKNEKSQWQIMMYSMIIKNKSNLKSREFFWSRNSRTYVMRKQWLHIDEMFNCCMCWTKWLKDFPFLSSWRGIFLWFGILVEYYNVVSCPVSDKLTLMWICNSLRHEHRTICVRFIGHRNKNKMKLKWKIDLEKIPRNSRNRLISVLRLVSQLKLSIINRSYCRPKIKRKIQRFSAWCMHPESRAQWLTFHVRRSIASPREKLLNKLPKKMCVFMEHDRRPCRRENHITRTRSD